MSPNAGYTGGHQAGRIPEQGRRELMTENPKRAESKVERCRAEVACLHQRTGVAPDQGFGLLVNGRGLCALCPEHKPESTRLRQH